VGPWGTWGNIGETRGGVGKSGVLEHKSGNTVSLIRVKSVKIDEKFDGEP